MKQKVNLIVFLLLAVLTSTPSKGQEMTTLQYVEDIEFFGHELTQRHKNLFAKINKEDFLNKLSQVKEQSLTKQSFVIALLKLIKEIGDEHTMIFESNYPKAYPIRFDIFKEGIFVVAADQSNPELLYQQLDGIEDHATDQIIKALTTLIKEGNPSYYDVYLTRMLANPTILNGIGISRSDLKTDFILAGKRHTCYPDEPQRAKIQAPLLRYSNNDNYWYSLIDNQQTLYFNYQNCSEQVGKPFEAFSQQLFQEVETGRPKRIIIDLRNNSGGNSAILQPFLEKLKESSLNTKGALYVLIGKNTFSSALMNAVDLKRNYNSILVGEFTSGSVNHYGEIRGFQLPHSKLEIGYSTRYWEVWKGYEGGLKPDHPIVYSIHNFKAGKDEAIDYVLTQETATLAK